MEVSFDPDKDAKNRAKYKLPLVFGVEVLTNKCGQVETSVTTTARDE
jgi:hypothetical protein